MVLTFCICSLGSLYNGIIVLRVIIEKLDIFRIIYKKIKKKKMLNIVLNINLKYFSNVIDE